MRIGGLSIIIPPTVVGGCLLLWGGFYSPLHSTRTLGSLGFCITSRLKMAISSYPSPADAGVLCVILANTAISISILKEIFRSILHVIGINVSSWEELTTEPSNSCTSPSESYMEEFRSRTPSTQYESVFICEECSICLNEFEPKAEINQLCCGHVFHKPCLEKWVNYWKTTCPLCRGDCMIPQQLQEDACPM